ncbi:MAG: hypothetical protein CSB49_07520 [Proteobacteria bacterium]|nr:MAG: hypothetical protein CSB49_07520 [Pseudomonadota bacterium]
MDRFLHALQGGQLPAGIRSVLDLRFGEETLDGDRLVRAQPMGVAEPVATYRASAYCLLVDADGPRRIDEATYRELVAGAEGHDLFLDLLSTVAAGRYRACRRDDDGFHEDSLTHQQAWGYAELMERRQPLRAGELEVLNSYGSPDKQVEAARRALDVEGEPLRVALDEAAPRRRPPSKALPLPAARGAAVGAAQAGRVTVGTGCCPDGRRCPMRATPQSGTTLTRRQRASSHSAPSTAGPGST